MAKLGSQQPRGEARRAAIVAFVAGYWRTTGYAPSLREVGDAVGLRSVSVVHRHVGLLVDAGVLAVDPRRQRSLRLAAVRLEMHSREGG